MTSVNFFGTPFYPGKPLTNSKFCKTAKAIFISLMVIGIIMASLYNIHPAGGYAGMALAPAFFITGVISNAFNKNWLSKTILLVIKNNQLDQFENIIDSLSIKGMACNNLNSNCGA